MVKMWRDYCELESRQTRFMDGLFLLVILLGAGSFCRHIFTTSDAWGVLLQWVSYFVSEGNRLRIHRIWRWSVPGWVMIVWGVLMLVVARRRVEFRRASSLRLLGQKWGARGS